MKKQMYFLLASLLISFSSYAQDTTIIIRSGGTDTVIGRHTDEGSYNFEKRRFNPLRQRWGLLDIGVNILSPQEEYRLDNGVDPFEQRVIKSTNINLHFLRVRLAAADGMVGIEAGASLEFYKYFFENPVVLQGNLPEVTLEYFEGTNFRKNRLTSTYLTFPLMLSLRSNPRRPFRSFNLAAGIDSGVLLGANFKTKLDDEKMKVKDNFNLVQWRSALRVELGVGPFMMYGSMGLRDLFDNGQDAGYKLTPYSFGLVILPY